MGSQDLSQELLPIITYFLGGYQAYYLSNKCYVLYFAYQWS